MRGCEPWPRIAVVGAGAVGGYFGGLLARAGAPVIMIGRRAFVEAANQGGLFLDTLQFQVKVRVEASTELAAVDGAEVVLFCVKTTDNAPTARAIAPLLAKGALVLSMQNGVDNAEQIRAAAAIEALPSVVYVAVSVPEAGRVKHVGRGDLVVGPKNPQTERIAALFSRRLAARSTATLREAPTPGKWLRRPSTRCSRWPEQPGSILLDWKTRERRWPARGKLLRRWPRLFLPRPRT